MTDAPSPHAARLEALETIMTHQERLIGELNEMVTAQWRKIDMLEREVLRLRDEFQNVGPTRDGPEPPPPHY